MERWKVVKGHPNYSVSNTGKVMRTTVGPYARKAGRILKQRLTEDGYLYTELDGRKKRKLHRLVAQAFVPNPKHKPEVHHKDTVKTNNAPSNLQWVTKVEHARLSAKLGQKSWHLQGRGVHFIARLGKWAAQYRRKWLGCFSTKAEALKAREVAINVIA